jgi:hypothetical protein
MSKVRAILVMAVFLLSILSSITSVNAQPLKQWDEAAKQKYSNAKSEYQILKGFYGDVRQDWITARNKYRGYKTVENAENALEKGKDFLLKADKAMVGYLEMVRAYVEGEPSLSDTERENIIRELDSYISWLEEKQPEIEGATTKKELVAIAGTVRNKWLEIRPATKRIVGQVMNAKVLWVINNAETASVKVEDAIEQLKEQGGDTTDLEAWLDDFNTKIDLAKGKHQAAKEKYAEISDVRDADKLFREGNAFVKEANQYLRSAYKDLKKIVKELRKYKTGEVTVGGTGRLIAEGDGNATISVNGTVDVSGEEGVLIVTDNHGDMIITVGGFGNKTELGENKWQYSGAGSAYITGSDIIVEFEGQNIDLTAEGTGSATLAGTGTYEACGKECLEGSWTAKGAPIVISAEVG